MARTRRIKVTNLGTARYHLMSRTNDRRFLFEKGSVKSELVAILKRAAEFSGVKLNAYCVMGNHFHVLCTVTRTEEKPAMAEVVRRVRVLYGDERADALAEEWEGMAAGGFTATLEARLDEFRARMNDVSEFMKTFKEVFGRWYKRGREYCGSIWSGRFKSTLVEDGAYFADCRRYVVYNPVRARIVAQAKDYAWSWSEEEGAETGVLSGERLLGRIAQVGAGKILGGEEFVRRTAAAMGGRFYAGHVEGHPVGDFAYSTHGWKVARRDGRVA